LCEGPSNACLIDPDVEAWELVGKGWGRDLWAADQVWERGEMKVTVEEAQAVKVFFQQHKCRRRRMNAIDETQRYGSWNEDLGCCRIQQEIGYSSRKTRQGSSTRKTVKIKAREGASTAVRRCCTPSRIATKIDDRCGSGRSHPNLRPLTERGDDSYRRPMVEQSHKGRGERKGE